MTKDGILKYICEEIDATQKCYNNNPCEVFMETLDFFYNIKEDVEKEIPVKPYSKTSMDGQVHLHCGKCANAIDVDDKYCRHCGKKVKYD